MQRKEGERPALSKHLARRMGDRWISFLTFVFFVPLWRNLFRVQAHTQFDVLTAGAAWNQLVAGLRWENLQLWVEDFKVFWASLVTNPTHISRLSNILLTFQLPILYNAG